MITTDDNIIQGFEQYIIDPFGAKCDSLYNLFYETDLSLIEFIHSYVPDKSLFETKLDYHTYNDTWRHYIINKTKKHIPYYYHSKKVRQIPVNELNIWEQLQKYLVKKEN